MTTRSVNVRHKGQMTLPIDVREDLDVKDGGTLLLERRGREWVLIRPEDIVDRTAGIFKDYAVHHPGSDPSREEIWIGIAKERGNLS